MAKKWNHIFDMAFSVSTNKKDEYKTTNREALVALQKRFEDIMEENKDHLDEPIGEWAGGGGDSFEEGA